KQLALYLERQVKPRRASNATRLTLVVLARFIEWRSLLTIVRPDTLIRWHCHAFRLLWRWKSRARTPADSARSSAVDHSDGEGELDLGRGAHRRRVVVEIGHLGVLTHREAIYAPTASFARTNVAGLEHVRPQSRSRRARV